MSLNTTATFRNQYPLFLAMSDRNKSYTWINHIEVEKLREYFINNIYFINNKNRIKIALNLKQ